MHAKNQDRSPCKISRYKQIFSAGFISVLRNVTLYFHFRCVARATFDTFDRNLIHSADACFLVMACVVYSHTQLKTLLSLLKQDDQATSVFSMAASAKIGCSIFTGDILFCAKHKIVGSRMRW